MQGGQGTLASVMEAAANVAASAKSGLDKTKAVVEEKAEKMSTRDQVEKDMATLRKEEKIDLAELRKCKAYAHNAIAASAAAPRFTDGGEFTTIGSFDQPAAANSGGQHEVVQYCRVPTHNVQDVVSSHRPVVTEQAQANANVGGADTNPTHTGMPAPVVEPDGVASGFKPDTNTGSGTRFSIN
ncbi:hypothetical protein ACET3Z_020682 [Daucus carota]